MGSGTYMRCDVQETYSEFSRNRSSLVNLTQPGWVPESFLYTWRLGLMIRLGAL